jgi:hypothetical protein
VPIAPPLEEKRYELPKQKSKILQSSEIRQLTLQGFSKGLARAMTENNASFPLRIWVVDNSGSMATCDGHRMVETKKSSDVKMVPCTRWSEIQDTVNYHVQMAALLQAPTVFRVSEKSSYYVLSYLHATLVTFINMMILVYGMKTISL